MPNSTNARSATLARISRLTAAPVAAIGLFFAAASTGAQLAGVTTMLTLSMVSALFISLLTLAKASTNQEIGLVAFVRGYADQVSRNPVLAVCAALPLGGSALFLGLTLSRWPFAALFGLAALVGGIWPTVSAAHTWTLEVALARAQRESLIGRLAASLGVTISTFESDGRWTATADGRIVITQLPPAAALNLGELEPRLAKLLPDFEVASSSFERVELEPTTGATRRRRAMQAQSHGLIHGISETPAVAGNVSAELLDFTDL